MKVKMYLQTEHLPAARGAENGSTEGASWGRTVMTQTERKGEAIRCMHVLGQTTNTEPGVFVTQWGNSAGRMESKPNRIEGKTLTTQGCLDSQAEKVRLCAVGTSKAGQVLKGPESERFIWLWYQQLLGKRWNWYKMKTFVWEPKISHFLFY